MPDRRRAGSFVSLMLVAGAFLLMLPPLEIGAVRLAGVSLLWWYVGAVAPATAVLAASVALLAPPRADAAHSREPRGPDAPRHAAGVAASERSVAATSDGSAGSSPSE